MRYSENCEGEKIGNGIGGWGSLTVKVGRSIIKNGVKYWGRFEKKLMR